MARQPRKTKRPDTKRYPTVFFYFFLLASVTSLPEQQVPPELPERQVPPGRPVQVPPQAPARGPVQVRVQVPPSRPAFALPPSCSQQLPSITSRRKAGKE